MNTIKILQIKYTKLTNCVSKLTCCESNFAQKICEHLVRLAAWVTIIKRWVVQRLDTGGWVHTVAVTVRRSPRVHRGADDKGGGSYSTGPALTSGPETAQWTTLHTYTLTSPPTHTHRSELFSHTRYSSTQNLTPPRTHTQKCIY